MPFSNHDYLYQHLPARVRRDDDGLFLKRFLQFFGATLDEWDAVYENFYASIDPATASEEFIKWWLWALFGWSWYPTWFDFTQRESAGGFLLLESGEELTTEEGGPITEEPTLPLSQGRQFYADFATHLARRGTKRGIEEFLKAFSIYARVSNRPQYWGEFVWGEAGYTMTGPLLVIVQVSHLRDEVNKDVRGMAFGEFVWGEGDHYKAVEPTLTRREIENLIRFEWPNGQRVMVEYQIRNNVAGS
jgi:hypothetical protein